MGRAGRRPGESGSRETILAAARATFGAVGFEKASVRAIAREAGVDPALVHHFFGTKDKLFVAAMSLPVDPAQISAALAAGPPDAAGERLARLFLSLWGDEAVRPSLLAVLRSAVSYPSAADTLRAFLSTVVLTQLTQPPSVVAHDDAQLRATLVGSQLVGLALARYVIQVEPLASAPPQAVVGWLAPTLQRYLTGPAPEAAAPSDSVGS